MKELMDDKFLTLSSFETCGSNLITYLALIIHILNWQPWKLRIHIERNFFLHIGRIYIKMMFWAKIKSREIWQINFAKSINKNNKLVQIENIFSTSFYECDITEKKKKKKKKVLALTYLSWSFDSRNKKIKLSLLSFITW